MVVSGGIVPGNIMLELAFYVAKQAGCTKAIVVGVQPHIAQFFLDQAQVAQGQFGIANAPGGFEAHPLAGVRIAPYRSLSYYEPTGATSCAHTELYSIVKP